MIAIVLVCFISAFLCVRWMQQRTKQDLMSASVPTVPGALPVLGHALQILGDSEHLFKFVTTYGEMANKCGGIAKIWLGPTQYFLVTDPKIAHTLMNACLQKSYMYNFACSWVGQGIFTAKAATWKNHRKLLNPTFGQHVLDSFVEVFNMQSKLLVERLASSVGVGEFDARVILHNIALESVCLTVMGFPDKNKTIIDQEYTDAAGKMLNIMMFRVQRLWMHVDFLYNRTSMKKKEDRLVKILKSTSENVMNLTPINSPLYSLADQKPCIKSHRFKAFLDLLLELNLEGSLNDREIREEIDTMIVAGSDTTASTLLYNLIVIGTYPKIQERIFKELEAVFQGSDRGVVKEDLPKLIYLEAVVKEVSRLYPIGASIVREVTQDVKFDDFTVPAGSSFFLMIWSLHRNACWGPDAKQFIPERWLDPERLPKEPGAYGAFGLGRRTCIGKAYALMSLKVSLANILRKYRVIGDCTKMKLKFDLLTKPVSGHYISLEAR